MYKEPISTGTTLIALQYDGGVVVGSDSRTSSGSFIASRVTDKITPITDKIVALRSGSAADTQAVADLVAYNVELKMIMENRPILVERTARTFQNYLYNYRDQLLCGIIIAGYDDEEKGQVYALPPGGFLLRERFSVSGSGSSFVMGYLDKEWKNDLTVEQAKQLVVNSVRLAQYRDGSSGGVIRLAIVDKEGTKRELIRPDKFPAIIEPNYFSMLPGHIVDD